MSLEELFVKGTYYCMVGNPIWYVYRAKVIARTDMMIRADGLLAEMRAQDPIRSLSQAAA